MSPIYQTSTFDFPSELSDSARSGGPTYLYTRYANPSLEDAAETIRSLEGAEAGLVFGSGMGAISATLLALLSPGEELVALEDLYGGTVALLETILPRFGVRVRWVSRGESGEPEKVVGPSTRLVLLESPTNPRLEVIDLARWSAAAHAVGARVLVDNTFATPINQTPVALGADAVVDSASKYLGGHSDLIGGGAVGAESPLRKISEIHLSLGSVMDPFAAFLLSRGLRTLPLRVHRQNRSAAQLVHDLESEPWVEELHYPGRESAEQEEIARKQMAGRGGVITLVVRGGFEGARRILRGLEIIHPASSLGGVESLASLPMQTSHSRLTTEQRRERGISDGMLRLSVGLEDPGTLLEDLRRAARGG